MASGRPDWYSSVAMHGKHDADLITVAVDELGNMLAKMQGLFGAELKTVAVDTDGIMMANLAVQSLPSMTVRPFYTESQWENVSTRLDAGETDTILTIAGTGVIHGGVFWCDASDYHDSSVWYIDIDTVTIAQFRLTNLQNYAIYSPLGFPLFVLVDNPSENLIRIGIQPGLTFEESIVFRAHNDLGELADDFGLLVWYSLIP